VPDALPLRPPRSILVIDDEESLRHALAKALRRAGYVVETAATGGEGADRFTKGAFDAVLTDVRLPDLSGLDVLALCTETRPDVPVIVMTGYGSIEGAMEAMRRGARDFVRKPFRTEEVLDLLSQVIAEPRGARDARLRARVERRFSPEGFARVEDALRRGPGEEGSTAPSSAGEPLSLKDATRRFEVRYVEDLLARTRGNVAAAARLAGISRPNFHRKLRTLGVDARRFKRAHRRGTGA
jgi:DNA-binding NtrC family response regulator